MAYEVSTQVCAPLQQVWDAWTTAESAQRWLAPKANVSFEEGGIYDPLAKRSENPKTADLDRVSA